MSRGLIIALVVGAIILVAIVAAVASRGGDDGRRGRAKERRRAPAVREDRHPGRHRDKDAEREVGRGGRKRLKRQ